MEINNEQNYIENEPLTKEQEQDLKDKGYPSNLEFETKLQRNYVITPDGHLRASNHNLIFQSWDQIREGEMVLVLTEEFFPVPAKVEMQWGPGINDNKEISNAQVEKVLDILNKYNEQSKLGRITDGSYRNIELTKEGIKSFLNEEQEIIKKFEEEYKYQSK